MPQAAGHKLARGSTELMPRAAIELHYYCGLGRPMIADETRLGPLPLETIQCPLAVRSLTPA